MTLKQTIMKRLYPMIMKLQKNQVNKNMKTSENSITPAVPFHALEGKLISQAPFAFSQLKGKKVLIVNVASNCGYTGQYSELETLYQQNREKLVILGFPANDFKDQEPGNNEQIESFCKLNYGVTFPLFQKQSVLKPNQSEAYKWLTDPSLNGWNSQAPTWNFCKYLIDENGRLIAFFEAPVSPLDKAITSSI